MGQPSIYEKLQQKRRALSVSELTAQIKILLEGRLIDVLVEGEVSNFRRHSSGHWYFTLKDEAAMIKCACYRTQNRLIRFTPTDGLTVRARGRLSVYETRGEYQLAVDFLEPSGIGALQLAFEQLKAKLEAEGLFDSGRKRGLPLLPRCIGVVTSPTGAAVRDILRTIKRRNDGISLLIAPVRVQGDGAAGDIVEAIALLNSLTEVDVIIVGRGGGSIEDLWCFNEEKVARAIFNSRVPVISAVGHETDFTIADFVADMRASTPSGAAELVAVARQDMCARVSGMSERMAASMRYRLLELSRKLSRLRSSRAIDLMPVVVRNMSRRIDDSVYAMESAVRKSLRKRRDGLGALSLRLRDADVRAAMARHNNALSLLNARLAGAIQAASAQGRERLSLAAGKLQSMSPLAVLGRGYAIAFDRKGRIIKHPLDVVRGDLVRVRVADGEMDCTKN
jgi:exodeoxyribonuclease VII large subunit